MCIEDVNLPTYSKKEEIWNATSHGLGALFGFVALILMLFKTIPAGDIFKIISSIIYGLSLIILFSISCIYHSLKPSNSKRILRILDHNAIYILLAGSYTPYTLVALRTADVWGCGEGTIGYIILGSVYFLCIIGVIFNLLNMDKYAWVSMICYLLGGWAIITAIVSLWNIIGPLASWLLIGSGIAYTIGSVLYCYGKRTPYMHTVFHFFVLVGAILMFCSIYFFVL